MYIVCTDTVIYGIGATEEAAWEDMERWIDPHEPSYSREAFYVYRATPALVQHVEEFGGAGIRWSRLKSGVCCMEVEAEAEAEAEASN